MNRGNQNFTAPENWRFRLDNGMYLMGTRNTRRNLQFMYRPFAGGGPLMNPREVFGLEPEPWRFFQEGAIAAPLRIPGFPEQGLHYPDQMTSAYHDPARNTYRTSSPSFPEPSSASSQQGRWGNALHAAEEEESKLTVDEQRQALNKLRKEVYFPLLNKYRRPNLYYREHYSLNRNEKDDDGKRCAVCLDDFEAREVVTVTPCKHMFHDDCIVPWVKSQGRCPVCRYAICERFRENRPAAPANNTNNNNVMESDPYEIEQISIIRAMEESFISENVRRY